MSSVHSEKRFRPCSNVTSCTKGAAGEAIEWYPGFGEYCPECGEALAFDVCSQAPGSTASAKAAVPVAARVTSPPPRRALFARLAQRARDLLARREISRHQAVASAVVIAYTGLCLYFLRSTLQSSSKSSLMIAITVALLPIVGVWCLRAPLIFPFCAYMAFVPFDNLVTGPVGSVTRLIAMASTGALLLRLCMTKDARPAGRSVLMWGLLIVWITASVIWAINVHVAIVNVQTYVQLYSLLLIVAITPVELREFKWVLASVIFGGVCAALYGDYLFIHSEGVNEEERVFVNAGGRMVDPNHFAASLLIAFALSMMIFLRTRFGVTKLAALAVVLMVGSGLQIAGSRGGFIAAVAAMLYFLIRSRYRAQLSIFAAIAAFGIVSSPLMARFALALSTGGNGRTAIWRTAFAAFKRSWLLGVGAGGFPDAYDRAWLLVNHGTFPHWHVQAHNLIAQTGIELGAVGLVLTFAAWLTQICDLHGLTAPEPFGDTRIALEGATISLLVASMFLDLMWYKSAWAAFILMAIARQYARGMAGDPATDEFRPRVAALTPGLAGIGADRAF